MSDVSSYLTSSDDPVINAVGASVVVCASIYLTVLMVRRIWLRWTRQHRKQAEMVVTYELCMLYPAFVQRMYEHYVDNMPYRGRLRHMHTHATPSHNQEQSSPPEWNNANSQHLYEELSSPDDSPRPLSRRNGPYPSLVSFGSLHIDIPEVATPPRVTTTAAAPGSPLNLLADDLGDFIKIYHVDLLQAAERITLITNASTHLRKVNPWILTSQQAEVLVDCALRRLYPIYVQQVVDEFVRFMAFLVYFSRPMTLAGNNHNVCHSPGGSRYGSLRMMNNPHGRLQNRNVRGR